MQLEDPLVSEPDLRADPIAEPTDPNPRCLHGQLVGVPVMLDSGVHIQIDAALEQIDRLVRPNAGASSRRIALNIKILHSRREQRLGRLETIPHNSRHGFHVDPIYPKTDDLRSGETDLASKKVLEDVRFGRTVRGQ